MAATAHPPQSHAHQSVAVSIVPASFDSPQVERGLASLTRMVGLGRYAELDAPYSSLAITPLDANESAALNWTRPGTLESACGGVEVQDMKRFVALLTGIDLAACADAPEAHRSWFSAAAAGRLSGTPWGPVHGIVDGPAGLGAAAQALRLTVSDGDHVVSVCARAEPRTWLGLLGQGSWQRKRNSMAGFRQLGIERSIRLATHTMPGSALRALRQGDIVLPDTPQFASDGSGTVVLGRLRLDVRFTHPASLEVLDMSEHISEEKDDGMSDPLIDDSSVLDRADDNEQEQDSEPVNVWADEDDDGGYASDEDGVGDLSGRDGQDHDDAQPAPEQAAPMPAPVAASIGEPMHADDEPAHLMPHDPLLDQLPVTMHFELGQLAMPLGDLRAVGPGVILPMKNGSPRNIAICVAGKRLGTGEAVEVDGQLAIRITQWSTGK